MASQRKEPVTLNDVFEASARIQPHIHRTAVMTSETFNDTTGARVFFKCENFQRAGVFKTRGAFNAVYSLSASEAQRGVVTSSSGNHAAAVSLAARTRGIRARIAMPRIALKSKIAAVHRYGGEIVWVDAKTAVPTSDDYDAAVARVQAETGAAVVHPYNDARTIAGQGTCALELLEQCPDLDLLLAPVGGGGLLAGTAIAAKGISKRVRIIGCEPEMADDARRSLAAGRIIPQLEPRTIADGLRTSLGDLTFAVISRAVDDIITVTENGIIEAMRSVWEILKIIIEPSAAVAVAALLERQLPIQARRVGIILSGGNADLERLPWLVASGEP